MGAAFEWLLEPIWLGPILAPLVLVVTGEIPHFLVRWMSSNSRILACHACMSGAGDDRKIRHLPRQLRRSFENGIEILEVFGKFSLWRRNDSIGLRCINDGAREKNEASVSQ
jgi:hypothetical protein